MRFELLLDIHYFILFYSLIQYILFIIISIKYIQEKKKKRIAQKNKIV